MVQIGKFSINISALTTGLTKGLALAQKKIRSFSAGIGGALKRVAQIGVAAGAAALGGLALIWKTSAKNIDALAKTSDRLGIATQELQALQHAGELAGVSSDKVGKSLEVMQKRLGEAAIGAGSAKKFLDEMGLSAQELINMRPDQQFRTIADAIAGLSTQSEKAAATSAIFSRGNSEILNLLQGGSSVIDDARAKIEKYGGALSAIDTAQVTASNDALTDVGAVITAIGNRFTVALSPFVEEAAKRFTNLAAEGGSMGNIITSALESVAKAVGFVADVVHVWRTAFKFTQSVITGAIAAIAKALAFLGKGFEKVLGLVGINVKITDTLDAIADGLADLAGEQFEEFRDKLTAPLPSKNIQKFFDDVRRKSRRAAEKIAEDQKNALATVAPDMKAAAPETPEALRDAAKDKGPQFAGSALRDSQAALSAINRAAGSARGAANRVGPSEPGSEMGTAMAGAAINRAAGSGRDAGLGKKLDDIIGKLTVMNQTIDRKLTSPGTVEFGNV